MPSRDEVRSLILPKNGFPTIASRAPIPVTTDRLFGACSIPTSELTFSARLTSRGARKTREVLMNASAYNEMKPHPTRRAAGSPPRSSVGASSGVGMPLDLRFGGERAKGIEPSPRAWEA
ncbi:MAG TPA: hypothetical protein VGW74_20760, partial [Propionibacteriaceae bacterium]|nr:hypothetical protein [Propionibacteriaceae bacterium]